MTNDTLADIRDARRGEIIERFLTTQDALAAGLDADTPATWRALAARIAGDLSALYLHIAGEELEFNPPHLRSVITARRKLREAGQTENPFMAQCLRSAEAANGIAARRSDDWPAARHRHRFAILVGMHCDMIGVLAGLWEDTAAHAATTTLGLRAEAIAEDLAAEHGIDTPSAAIPANDAKEPHHDQPV